MQQTETAPETKIAMLMIGAIAVMIAITVWQFTLTIALISSATVGAIKYDRSQRAEDRIIVNRYDANSVVRKFRLVMGYR